MNSFAAAVLAAAWLGFLTSISPCPLATNIAAVGFIGRKVGSAKAVLLSGALYTLGRCLAYALLGAGLVAGSMSAPELSHVLQKYMNLLMGPLLVLVAMVLLGLLRPSVGGSGIGEWAQKRAERLGAAGALPLGAVFALSFCPTSAALFFGSLLPLAVQHRSGVGLPVVFGVATALPVLFFAFLLAFGANRIGRAYDRLARFEVWAERLTGVVFLLVGIWMTLTITLR